MVILQKWLTVKGGQDTDISTYEGVPRPHKEEISIFYNMYTSHSANTNIKALMHDSVM